MFWCRWHAGRDLVMLVSQKISTNIWPKRKIWGEIGLENGPTLFLEMYKAMNISEDRALFSFLP